MLENKITDEDIIAFVHYEQGYKDYFRLSDKRAQAIKKEIFSDSKLEERYLDHKTTFNIASKSVKSVNWKYLTTAAIFVVAFFSYYFYTSAMQEISFNDFNIKVLRSEVNQESSKISTWIHQIRDGQLKEVLNDIENDFSMSSSLIYATVLILHGQETENIALLKQGKAILFNYDIDRNVLDKLDDLIDKLEMDNK